FLTLQPTVAVINNVEADHMECYGTLDVLYQSFATFAGGAVDVFIGTTDSGSDAVAALLGDRVIRFGLEPESDIRVIERQAQEGHNRGIVAWPDGLRVELELRVPGDHNMRNAVAALAVVRPLGYDPAVAPSAQASVTGVGGRFKRHR